MTRAQLRQSIRRGELTATLLRQPGFSRLGVEERRRIADDIDMLAQAARRLFDADSFAETPPLYDQPMPDARALYDQSADDDATESDLWGSAP